MKLIVLLFVCLAAIVMADEAAEIKAEWKAFKELHKKVYKNAEDEKAHLATYLKSKATIEAHNERYAQGKESYDMGINEFSDTEHEDFLQTYTGAKVPRPATN